MYILSPILLTSTIYYSLHKLLIHGPAIIKFILTLMHPPVRYPEIMSSIVWKSQ